MFSKTTKLTQHLRTHTGGGKLFKCDICDKSYSQSSSLGLHKRKIHYGNHGDNNERKTQIKTPKINHTPTDDVVFDQVFECHSCNKQFSKAASLKQQYVIFNYDNLSNFPQLVFIILQLSHSSRNPAI